MNTIQATQLYQELQTRVDNTKPIKPRLLKLFIPVFWDGSVALRTSWKGRIASLLERPAEYLSNCSKIYRAFSIAMQKLLADRDQCQKLNPPLAFKMLDELEVECLGSVELDPDIFSSPEYEALKVQKEEKNRVYWDKISRLSLLHSVSQNAIPVDLNTLKSILSSNVEANPDKALDFLEKFINRHPAYAVLEWREKLKRIRESCEKDHKITDLFKNDSHLKPEEKALQDQKHTKLLHELSREMAVQVQALDPAKGDKKLFQFSYGPKTLSVSALIELRRNIPEDALKSISQQYNHIILNDDIHSFEKIGETAIGAFFDRLSSAKMKGSHDSLRPNPDRHIPEHVAARLPKIFEIWLENILKKGVVGNAALLMPDENLKQALEWMSEHGDSLFLHHPEALKKLKEELTAVFKLHLKFIQENYGNAFIRFLKWSHKVVTPVFMELLDIDHLMVSGPLWLEFEKNRDATFNVTVYTLGKALNYHPIDQATGKQYSVMRMKNVQAGKLNKQFFHSLLKRHVDPINNPSNASKAYDIYSGPLSTLEGAIDNCLADDPKGLDSKSPTIWQLALNLLLKQNIEGYNPSLEVCFQAMIEFCKPLMQRGRLVIPDADTCHTLENTVKEVYTYLHQTQLPLQEKHKIKATCTVVRKGIFEYYEGLKKFPLDIKIATLALDKDWLKALKDYILGMNISQSQLREYRGTLSYYLGEEFGEFIDHLLQHSEHLLREKLPPSNDRAPNGIFGQMYASVYFSTIKNAVVLSAIGIGLAYQGWTHLLALGGFYYFLPLPNLDHLMPYAQSKNLVEWYGRIKDALLRKTSEGIILGIWALMPNQSRDKLKGAIETWRQSVQYSTDLLRGVKRVNYKLPAVIPLKKGAAPREIPLKVTSFFSGLDGLGRFAFPAEKIKCTAMEGTDVLAKIEFSPKLAFKITPNTHGRLEAVSDHFPGYHIAEDQQHAALKNIPSYLILENHGGHKKALIPKHQWLQTLLGRTLSYFTGPFSEVALKSAAAALPNKDEYFLFDIEPSANTKEKNILSSSEPDACIYLLCLYYLINNTKALKETLRRFDWLCNTKPIPWTVLDQLVPLAFIPFNFGRLRAFRRKLFSTIGQHLADKPYGATTSCLILGIVSLMDLDAYYEYKSSRENFSVLQQYHLYKFSFRMLSEPLSVTSKKAGSMIEHGGIETFIELFGLSNNLNERYLEIKKKLGVPETATLWRAKKAAGILRTPSTLPKYLSTGDTIDLPTNSGEPWGLYATRILSYGRTIKSTYLKSLNLHHLSQEMVYDIQSIPVLKADKMSPEIIKQHFPAYYAMARNDHPKITPALRQQLREALKLLKGMGGKQSRVLLHYLETAFLYTDKCPPTRELAPKQEAQFFKELNDLAFGKLIEKEVVDPAWKNVLHHIGAHYTTLTLTDGMAPYLFPPGLAQIVVDITTHATRSMIYDQLTHASKPLLKYIPSFTEPLVGKSDNTPLQKAHAVVRRILVPINLMMLTHYSLEALAPRTAPANSAYDTYVSWIGYQALTLVGSAFLRIALTKLTNKKLKLDSVLPKIKGISTKPMAWLANKTYNYVKPRAIASILGSVAEIEAEYVEHKHNEYAILKALDKACVQFIRDQKPETAPLLLYTALTQHRSSLAKHMESDKQKLLDLFNTPFKFGPENMVPLNLKEIHGLLDKGQLTQACKTAGLSNFEHHLIEKAVVRIDYYKYRLKQFDGLLTLVKKGSTPDKIAGELQKCASVNLQNVPMQNVRKYLRYIASSKTQLLSYELFANKPLAKVFKANKTRFAASPLPADMKTLHEELWTPFGKRSHVLQINRGIVLTVQKLQSIFVMMKGGVLEEEPVLYDYQELQSIFIERMYRYTHHKDARKPEDEECLILLKQILGLIKQQGEMPPSSSKAQITYPIRNPKSIQPNYYFITEACIKCIIQNGDLKPLIEKGNLSSIELKTYREIIQPRLAEKMSLYTRFEITEAAKRSEFIDFVCDRVQHVPSWIADDDRLYSEISLVKGILNHMLPLCFAKEQPTTMKIPYETLFRKGLDLALAKLNASQGQLLAKALVDSAKTQMYINGIDYQHTYLYKKFGKIFTPEKYTKFDSEDIAKLINHPEASLFYIRYFLWKECGYWEHAIQNTPHDLAGLFQNPPKEPKQSAYNQILATPDQSFKTWMAIFKEQEADLIDETEDDPAKLFGFTAYEASKNGFVNPLVDLGIEQKLVLTPAQAALPKETPQYKRLQHPPQFTSPAFREWTWPAVADPLTIESCKACPIHKVQDLLFNSNQRDLEKVAFAFDGRLWMSTNFTHTEPANLKTILVHVNSVDGRWEVDGMMPLTPNEELSWKRMLANKSQDETRGAFLWNLSLNQHAAGYKPEKLPADFTTLVNQLKFLNGDVNYSLQGMPEWVQGHHPSNLKAAFDVISSRRARQPQEGSDIDHIFIKTCNLPYEEQM